MRIKHPREHCLVVARGGAVDPTTIAPGTTGQVLTATTGADPSFAAPATVDLTTGVTGVLPLANGGTGNAVGPIVTVPWGPFYGTAVAAGGTVFLGHDDDATELNVQWRAPVAGTVVAMYGQTSVAAGAAETFVYTLRVELVDTALVMTITGTGGGGRAGTASGSIAVAANHVVSLKLVTSGGAGIANHQVSLAFRVQN